MPGAHNQASEIPSQNALPKVEKYARLQCATLKSWKEPGDETMLNVHVQ